MNPNEKYFPYSKMQNPIRANHWYIGFIASPYPMDLGGDRMLRITHSNDSSMINSVMFIRSNGYVKYSPLSFYLFAGDILLK